MNFKEKKSICFNLENMVRRKKFKTALIMASKTLKQKDLFLDYFRKN